MAPIVHQPRRVEKLPPLQQLKTSFSTCERLPCYPQHRDPNAHVPLQVHPPREGASGKPARSDPAFYSISHNNSGNSTAVSSASSVDKRQSFGRRIWESTPRESGSTRTIEQHAQDFHVHGLSQGEHDGALALCGLKNGDSNSSSRSGSGEASPTKMPTYDHFHHDNCPAYSHHATRRLPFPPGASSDNRTALPQYSHSHSHSHSHVGARSDGRLDHPDYRLSRDPPTLNSTDSAACGSSNFGFPNANPHNPLKHNSQSHDPDATQSPTSSPNFKRHQDPPDPPPRKRAKKTSKGKPRSPPGVLLNNRARQKSTSTSRSGRAKMPRTTRTTARTIRYEPYPVRQAVPQSSTAGDDGAGCVGTKSSSANTPSGQSASLDTAVDSAGEDGPINDWCTFQPCTYKSSPARKMISQFFGRNKSCSAKMKNYLCNVCRKHYQRKRYHFEKSGTFYTCQYRLVHTSLINRSRDYPQQNWKICYGKSLSDAMTAYVRDEHAAFTHGDVVKRSDADSESDREKAYNGVRASTCQYIMKHLDKAQGDRKTTQQCLDVLDDMFDCCQGLRVKNLPLIEFLPQEDGPATADS